MLVDFSGGPNGNIAIHVLYPDLHVSGRLTQSQGQFLSVSSSDLQWYRTGSNRLYDFQEGLEVFARQMRITATGTGNSHFQCVRRAIQFLVKDPRRVVVTGKTTN